MAIGFLLLDGTTRAIPDKNLSKTTKPRVLKSNFGDGYELRIRDGINNLNQTFTVTFNNRPAAEIDDIVSFLDAKAGVTKFEYVYPNTNGAGNETAVKVVCEDYGITYSYDNYSSLTATFRRVYEA